MLEGSNLDENLFPIDTTSEHLQGLSRWCGLLGVPVDLWVVEQGWYPHAPRQITSSFWGTAKQRRTRKLEGSKARPPGEELPNVHCKQKHPDAEATAKAVPGDPLPDQRAHDPTKVQRTVLPESNPQRE